VVFSQLGVGWQGFFGGVAFFLGWFSIGGGGSAVQVREEMAKKTRHAVLRCVCGFGSREG